MLGGNAQTPKPFTEAIDTTRSRSRGRGIRGSRLGFSPSSRKRAHSSHSWTAAGARKETSRWARVCRLHLRRRPRDTSLASLLAAPRETNRKGDTSPFCLPRHRGPRRPSFGSGKSGCSRRTPNPGIVGTSLQQLVVAKLKALHSPSISCHQHCDLRNRKCNARKRIRYAGSCIPRRTASI